MRLVETIPGENEAICLFEMRIGDKLTFNVTRSPISKEIEALLVEQMQTILDNEGE